MRKVDELKIDENVAYFIGVLHSDGCIYVFNDKKKQRTSLRLNLTIAEKSLPMALKFKKILFDYFGISVNLRKRTCDGLFVIQTSINRNWHIFEKWDEEKLPYEIQNDIKLFGAYLAGVIDGDGYVKIKNNKDRKVPQCIIKISSDHSLCTLGSIIEKFMKCKVHFEYEKNSRGVATCFYISKKNMSVIKSSVCPHIELIHKKVAFEKFFNMKK